MKQTILTLMILGLLNACASPGRTPAPVETRDIPAETQPSVVGPPLPPEQPGPAVVPDEEPLPSIPPPPPRPSASSTLLASVDSAIASGNLEQAAALAERAIRISPRDGRLWLRLGSIRFEQERFAEAAGFARRALSFAGADPALGRASTSLLERATAAQENELQ